MKKHGHTYTNKNHPNSERTTYKGYGETFIERSIYKNVLVCCVLELMIKCEGDVHIKGLCML